MAVEQTADTAEKAGIPQLDFTAFPNQIFWLAIFGLAIYLVVSRLAKPRIGDIIEQRERRIQNALDAAEQSRTSVSGLEKEIVELLDKAKGEAESTSAATRNEILQLQNQAMEKVREQITEETRQAESRLHDLRSASGVMVDEIARSTAAEIITRIMPGTETSSRLDDALAKSGSRNT